MVRLVLPLALALLLPSCSGPSDVSCSFDSGMTQLACADFTFSGASQDVDVPAFERGVCVSGGGTVVDTCPATNTLGACTIEESADAEALTAVEQVYAVNGVTAAAAQATCASLNGSNGITTTWATACNTVADCPAMCSGGWFTPAAAACTAHVCTAPPPQRCDPYGCAGDVCATTCAQDSDCTVGPCNACPPDVELCLAPLAPAASLPAGACKKVLAACDPGLHPTCGPVGSFTVGSSPSAMAFDGTNLWVTDAHNGSVVELSPSGATLGTFNVGTAPSGIAFDGTNMWVTTFGGVVEVSPTGALLGTFIADSSPVAIAFDGTNMWVATEAGGGTGVVELSPAGATLGSFFLSAHVGPSAIAFDGTNMWVATSGSVIVVSPAGATIGTFSVGKYSSAIAFDGKNMWVTDVLDGVVTELSPSGATVGTFPVGKSPSGIAFDGTNMWVLSVLGGTVTKLSPAGVTLGTFPFDSGGNQAGGGIAFDGQHMWVSDSLAQGNNVTEL